MAGAQGETKRVVRAEFAEVVSQLTEGLVVMGRSQVLL